MMSRDYDAIVDELNDAVEQFEISEEDKDMLHSTMDTVKDTLESTGHEIKRYDSYPTMKRIIIETKDNFNIVIEMMDGSPIIYRQKE